MPNNEFYPFLNVMPLLDSAIQIGRGVAAAVYGQTYNVYRLSNTTNVSVYDQSPVITKFPMSVTKASKTVIENQTFDLLVYQGECDNRSLELGDVLVETGFESEPGNVFIFAQRRPFIGQNLFVRCESNISITRPQPRGGGSGQQPGPGQIVDAGGYVGIDKQAEWVLTLQNGVYSFANVPGLTASAIPAGLQPLNRIRDGKDPKIPTLLYREHFLIYLPLFPGEQLQELDRLNFPNQDRYESASIYTSEQTGLGGYIIITEKLGT